jgi:hypothetical protein
VQIKPAQGYKPPVPTIPAAARAGGELDSGQEAGEDPDAGDAAAEYQISIARPQQEETLWNLEGQLDVSLDVEPRLKRGDRIRIFVDGEEITGAPQRASSFTVSEVWRGAHTLRAGIYDSRGRELAVSDTVRFYVQQTSTQNPNSQTNPANRPPVRPTPRGGG